MADFGPPQPRDRGEKENVAREVLGQKTHSRTHAPKFHRMSITAAQNGVSINHTMKVPVKKGKNTNSGQISGGVTPMSGDDGMVHKDTEHVFGHDHPVMEHLHAIHQHIMTNMRNQGNPAGAEDFDGDSD